MIFHQFKELLAKEGVKEIEAKGKEFDPEVMNAVMHIEEENFGSCFETADQQEGMGAFLEKRKHAPFTNQ